MNLETKITIYKFTPQVFTLPRFYLLILLVYSRLIGDIPKIIKFKATISLRVSCLFCIFKHSPQKTV